MALRISPEIEARIAEMVDREHYPDANALIERALDVLDDFDRLEHLRNLLAVSAKQAAKGEIVPFDDALRQEIRRRARERFAAGEVAGPDVRP